jgi:hypothetical protein
MPSMLTTLTGFVITELVERAMFVFLELLISFQCVVFLKSLFWDPYCSICTLMIHEIKLYIALFFVLLMI